MCRIDTADNGEGFATHHFSRLVTAVKDRKCSECHAVIAKGEEYEVVTANWDGPKEQHFTCSPCLEIRDVFFDSWCYGTIWEDMRDDCEEQEIGIGQLDRLSPAAVGKLEDMLGDQWREWICNEDCGLWCRYWRPIYIHDNRECIGKPGIRQPSVRPDEPVN